EALQYRTQSTIIEAGLTYPFIRARERNLNLSAFAFLTDDRGSIFELPNTPPSTHDRIRGVRARLDADAADSSQGISQVNVVLSQGIHGLGSTNNGQDLASRANGRVDFTKVEATATRLQPLFANFSILAAAYGQYAVNPLLASELCGYGGRVFGRAYDPSELLADRCLIALGEMR